MVVDGFHRGISQWWWMDSIEEFHNGGGWLRSPSTMSTHHGMWKCLVEMARRENELHATIHSMGCENG